MNVFRVEVVVAKTQEQHASGQSNLKNTGSTCALFGTDSVVGQNTDMLMNILNCESIFFFLDPEPVQLIKIWLSNLGGRVARQKKNPQNWLTNQFLKLNSQAVISVP